jgi:outer membrane protein TolC
LIEKNKLYNDLRIYKENYSWVSKILKVTKKLYSNGSTSQQAMLEIQVRKSELNSSVKSAEFDIESVNERMSYLVGDSQTDIKNIPWQILEKVTKTIDHREESMKFILDSTQASYKSSSRNLIPDVTLSFGYTKRSDIDDNGDFVSASIAIPIPISSKKYAKQKVALIQSIRADINLANYRKNKMSMERSLKSKSRKFESELSILKGQSIKYAESSRAITSKSYGLGEASYIELLQSEIKLQALRLKSNMLTSVYRKTRVELKLLRGEYLNE